MTGVPKCALNLCILRDLRTDRGGDEAFVLRGINQYAGPAIDEGIVVQPASNPPGFKRRRDAAFCSLSGALRQFQRFVELSIVKKLIEDERSRGGGTEQVETYPFIARVAWGSLACTHAVSHAGRNPADHSNDAQEIP